MAIADCPRWATDLLKQAEDLSSITIRAQREAMLAKSDCEQSLQLLSKLQRQMEAAEGSPQRETRRMIKLEAVDGLSGDLERLVGTLAWQETRYAAARSRSSAVPDSLLARQPALQGAAPQTEPQTTRTPSIPMGDRVARLARIAAEAKARGRSSSPLFQYVVASGPGGSSQQPTTTECKAGRGDGVAQSDEESDTGSDHSESSSNWSGPAAEQLDDEVVARKNGERRASPRTSERLPPTGERWCCPQPLSLNAAFGETAADGCQLLALVAEASDLKQQEAQILRSTTIEENEGGCAVMGVRDFWGVAVPN